MFRPILILTFILLYSPYFSFANPFNHEPPYTYHSISPLLYTSQIITVKSTPSGESIYTIQADFAKTSGSDLSDIPESVQRHDFLLSLYTSHNILGGTCPDFQPLTCESTYGCQPVSENTVNITLPYTSVIGSTGQTGFYFDYLSYYSSQTPFVFPQKCVGGVIAGEDAGQTVAGMIGMGINGSARNIFHRDFPMFSIYLAPNGAYGQIVFGLDTDIVDETIDPLSFRASENWEMPLENSLIVMGNNSVEFDGAAIFDLNLNSIGLPSEIYDSVIAWLSSQYGVNCTGNLCKSAINYGDLPALTISAQYSDLIIQPTTYMSPYSGSTYRLQLSRIVSNNDNATIQQENDVKVNAGYENYIIMGSPVLMSYYVAFQKHSNGPAIHMFKTTIKNNFMLVVFLAGLALCTFMLAIVILGVVIKRSASRTVPESPMRTHNQQPEQSAMSEQSYVQLVEGTL